MTRLERWKKQRTEKWGHKYRERVPEIRIFLSTFFCPIRPRRQILYSSHSGHSWFSVTDSGRRPGWVIRVFRGYLRSSDSEQVTTKHTNYRKLSDKNHPQISQIFAEK